LLGAARAGRLDELPRPADRRSAASGSDASRPDRALLLAGLLGAALALGGLSAVKPTWALGLLAAGLLAVVAVRAPVATCWR